MADPVLTAEREQLRRSRDYLSLMREDVLSLEAMAGDRVSQEYLKAELYHRAEALKDLPDTPLFFGRLDYAPTETATHPEPYSVPDIPKLEYPRTGYWGTASTSAVGTCTPRTARPR